VILPPSPHPSGGTYGWPEKKQVLPAPDWLVALTAKEASSYCPSFGETNTYGQSALTQELAELAAATQGERNDSLNRAAFNLGQLVAGGQLNQGQAESSLLGVAMGLGLNQKEAIKTISSGIRSGMENPRGPNDNGFHDGVSGSKQASAEIEGVMELSAKCKQDVSGDNRSLPNSLATAIEEWVVESEGLFTVEQLDREFGLTTRAQKNNRSQVLYRLRDKKIIKKDTKRKGVYHVLDSSVEWIDIEAPEESAFPLILPFSVHEKVLIPPHSIIVLAGSSNAGKTAFILNTLRMNLHQPYHVDYYMSEMGSGEFKSRIKGFNDPLKEWKKVRVASKSYNFDAAIEHHNPNGLSCIDFLEEIEGEYFKIPSSIRAIYDALKDGVAFIAIQKKTSSEYARGGEATGEKARLYMALDNIAVLEDSIVCALKVIKAKHFLDVNINKHEIHFKIERGCKLTPLGTWQLSSMVNRELVRRKWEANEDDPDFYFRTRSDVQRRITLKQAEKWQVQFKNINVAKELQQISDDSFKRDFLSDGSGYFFQLANILAKKNEKNQRSN